MTNDIQKITLKGHSQSVLCLAHSSSSLHHHQHQHSTTTPNNNHNTCLLLSGSEDGTARLWDLRQSNGRATMCIIPPATGDAKDDVTSVTFQPPPSLRQQRQRHQKRNGAKQQQQQQQSSNDDTSSSSSPYRYDATIYLSAGSITYGYDLRQTSSPIIRSSSPEPLPFDNADEINDLRCTAIGRDLYLANGDDEGEIRVLISSHDDFISDGGRRMKRVVLNHWDTKEEEGTVVVTSVAFRPTTGGGGVVRSVDGGIVELASGGTDCAVRLWDVNRPR